MGFDIKNGKASKPPEGFIPNPKLKLLDQVSEVMRFKHYSMRTEATYREWIKRFILFHGKRHPREMGSPEISRFLSDLAVRGKVAASTQNQAFNALLFLYREVLHQEMGQVENVERAKRPARLPVVLSKGEVERVLAGMTGTLQLMARLLYGTGMRLMECVRLRVKDVDFERNQIVVRDGKGSKDRVTVLPESVRAGLQGHLERVKLLHEKDASPTTSGICGSDRSRPFGTRPHATLVPNAEALGYYQTAPPGLRTSVHRPPPTPQPSRGLLTPSPGFCITCV